MPEHETREITLPRAVRTVTQDFYLSYRFSQGAPDVQHLLFAALAGGYDPRVRDDIQQNIPEIQRRLASFNTIPANHMPVGGRTRTYSYGEETRHFIHILATRNESVRHSELASIANGILDRDIRFQDPVRLRGSNSADPHQSHFRDYILYGTPTGSESFDALFRDIEAQFSNYAFPDSVYEEFEILGHAWQKVHPGSKF